MSNNSTAGNDNIQKEYSYSIKKATIWELRNILNNAYKLRNSSEQYIYSVYEQIPTSEGRIQEHWLIKLSVLTY